MNAFWKSFLFWAPRVLGLGFTLFLGLFAMDVFTEGYGILETVAALFYHLAPAGIVLLILVIAWRWAWIGALVYPCLAAWYLLSTLSRIHWSNGVVIAGPLFLLGALFLMDWVAHVWSRLRNAP